MSFVPVVFLPTLLGHRWPVERQRRVRVRLQLVEQTGAAGIQVIARSSLDWRDEGCRNREVTYFQAGFAQPTRGTCRGTGLVEREPAANHRAFACRIDPDMDNIVARDVAGGVRYAPFEG